MRIALVTFFLSLTLAGMAIEPFTWKARQLFMRAEADEESCVNLLDLCKGYSEQADPLMAGYEACARMLMAQHLINPWSKYQSFKQGAEQLERCVKGNPTNIELRFLRFSVQTKAPAFLGYNQSISKDKDFLLLSLDRVLDAGLAKTIRAFLLQSNALNETEKNKI